MNKTLYLFGDEPIKAIPLDVIYSRLVALERRINKVMSKDLMNRDDRLKRELLKARDWYNKLIATEKEYFKEIK